MTKEEILGSNDIGSGSLYFNRAMQSMDEYAEQQAIAFLNWTWENGWVRCYYDGAYHGYYNSKLFTDGNIEEITTEQLYKLFIDNLK